MAGTAALNQPLSFDPFSHSYQLKQQQTYADFSPASLYTPLEDFSTDFTTDSAPSPSSPLSPVFGASYTLPTGADWASWDKVDQSTESASYLKTEPYDSPILSSIPTRNISLSPAINPMDLSNPIPEDVAFGREGMNDTQPIFQSPPVSNRPTPVSAPALKTPRAMPAAKVSTTEASRRQRNSLKRKSSDSESSSTSSPRSSASPPPAQRRHLSPTSNDIALPPKKTAHNMIEKRYRTNLNDKIAALRDSVPALRVMVHRLEHTNSSGEEAEDEAFGMGMGMKIGEEDDLGGLTPAHKLNKATILSKATEYIAHLERRNRNLAKENAALRGRVEGFEMLVMSRGGARGVWN